MRHFDQGSVYSSYLMVGQAGKGRTPQTRINTGFVQPPNLVLPVSVRIPVHRHTCAHTRVCVFTYRSDRVRRLDGFNNGVGLQPSNLCLTFVQPSDISGFDVDIEKILIEMRSDYPNACRALRTMGWPDDEIAETNDLIVALKNKILAHRVEDDVETLVCWRNWLRGLAQQAVGGKS